MQASPDSAPPPAPTKGDVASGQLLTAMATVVAGAAVLLSALTVASRASPRTALNIFLDLLLAAGLLRLAAANTWSAIASAAAVVAIRKVAVSRLRFSAAAEREDRP